jgi:nicotinate-nucleotide adenylyltransferase
VTRDAGATPERLSGVRRLGIMGGSFDPVHVGHLHVASAAAAAFELEHVLFVPAARPPHKPGRRLAPGADRVAMLRLALADRPDWSIDALELEREGPSYTIDTVRALPARHGLPPGCRLHLVIGWDNLRGLERWREVRALLEAVQPVVVYRRPEPPGGSSAAPDRAQDLLACLRRELGPELFGRLERGLVEVEPVPVSSTAIRAELACGRDPGAALPPGVGEYARRRGLYGSDPD